MNEEDVKRAMKEALKEWLSDRFTEFGRFSMGAIGALLLASIVYFILTMHGWNR